MGGSRFRSDLAISIRSLDLDLDRNHKPGFSYIQVKCGSGQVSRESSLGLTYTGTKRRSSWKRRRVVFEFCDIDRPSDVFVFKFDRLTWNRVEFALKYTCRFLFRIGSLATRRQERCILKSNYIPRFFGQGSRTLNIMPNCDRTQRTSKVKGYKIARRLKW